MFLVLLIFMGLLILLGFPMFVALVLPTVICLIGYMPSIPLMIVCQQMIDGIKIFSLLAVPLFIFAADIMTKGQTANRLVNFVLSLIGHIPGGLAHTTIVSCTLFGAVSGSTQATVAAIGKVMRPKLLKGGYRDSFNMAMFINASDIANLIPPSITMILYCICVKASVGELFLAGIGPGIIICFFFMVYTYFWAKYNKISLQPKADLKQIWKSSKEAIWAFGVPVIIIGGIYGGIFSPTEAAAASAIYALFIEIFIYKSITIKDIPQIALSTATVNAVIFILIGGAKLLSWFLTVSGMPKALMNFIMGMDPSRITFLLLINILFFVSCMFINPAAVILVLSPMVYPVAMDFGVDPIHLGIIITMQIAIGSATPPFGIDIFTACAVFKKRYWDVIRETPPFIIILLVIVILLTIFPNLSLFTRNIFFD